VPRAFTLVEMVVSLALTGAVLSLVAGIALRQQRLIDDLSQRRAVASRLQEASVLLPIHLRSASPRDFRVVMDTALELRATIATAVVCDTAPSQLVLAPAVQGDSDYASYLSPIEVGDSAWVLVPSDSAAEWRGTRISAVGSREPGACNALGPTLSDAGRGVPRPTVSITASFPSSIGLPVRVTRPVRYSLYRASDGDWYVGEREWNDMLGRFNAIQPVVGPFRKPDSGGLVFRYDDTTGSPLPAPVDPREIALVRVELRAETRAAPRAFAVAGATGPHVDSTLLMIALRGHP
jgi:hypothetical protein